MLPSLSGPAPVEALPTLIQGGMGVAVSSWLLASAVARRGQLGVVSGTALDLVLARRLQDGDVDGSARRAIAAFPGRGLAQRVLTRYLRVGGRSGAPYRPVPRPSLLPRRAAQELTVLANFVEVWLAKEGHRGRVGVNYLEKIQLATPAAAYGAMLAGVDAVLMGAGIPRHLPRLLDALARHRAVRLPVDVAGGGEAAVTLDPGDLLGPDTADLPELRRPLFLAIISSEALAGYLNKDPEIRPDGFVVEAPSAGGHNAPPRGRVVLDERGQPRFGPRDHADVAKIAAVGLPFWLAGGRGTPEALRDALAAGAAGVQVGTPFALCAESGLTAQLRAQVLTRLHDGTLEVLTDADASPTGFPFKVAQLAGSLSDRAVRARRPRLCDLGYLRTPYRKGDGDVGYRCPAEPVAAFVAKGGQEQDAEGSVCLCNALTADVGLGQVDPEGRTELPLVTLGADLDGARRLAALHPEGWTADQAIDWLLSAEPALT